MLVAILVVLIILATFDLWVGVTNDAVNFLNSAIGSQIARRRTIYIIATVGIVFGAVLSSGMMEVARKGIFDPAFFAVEEGGIDPELLITIYLAVMVTDVIFLDLFNTLGLPTSTTVSIVSELLGAALGVAFWMSGGDFGAAAEAIEWGGAGKIYMGIGLSVVVSFTLGALTMLGLRLIFTRDLSTTFRKFGWLWVGFSAVAMLYFVIFKAGKNAFFMTDEAKAFIEANIVVIMSVVFMACAALTQVVAETPDKVFKIVILVGTFALAAAFAGNDLVNFIGPTVAAGQAALTDVDMSQAKVPTPTWALLLAGTVMALALWRSKKAASVSDTEIRLAASGSMDQRFKSNAAARFVVGAGAALLNGIALLIPFRARRLANMRTGTGQLKVDAPPYDHLRASVNLTVAAIVISIGTAMKLPLSTTYVTFTAAMGAALADRAWGDRKSSEARISGVMIVIGGWIMTGVLTSVGAFIAASIIFNLGLPIGATVLVIIVFFALYRLSKSHRKNLGKKETVNDMLDKKLG